MTDENIRMMDTYLNVLVEAGRGLKHLRRRIAADGNKGAALLVEMASAQLKDTINILVKAKGAEEPVFRSVRGK